MKKRPKKGPADPDAPARQLLAPDREIARRMAMQALNACHRDKIEARRLFKQWLKENDDLLEAVAGPAITLQITIAVSQDVRIERQDVLKQSRALPIALSQYANPAKLWSRMGLGLSPEEKP
jgi:hypothetical protein